MVSKRMFFLLLIPVMIISTQERFRSILLERACRRRPTLRFCRDFAPLLEATTIPVDSISETSTLSGLNANSAETLLEDNIARPKMSLQDFGNSTRVDEHEGSLLRLPKPVRTQEEPVTVMSKAKTEPSITHQTQGVNATIGSNKEDEKSVLVFVSEYCVVERERFVRICHGNVKEDQIAFCKSYPPACTSTSDVIPVLTYCQSYYRHYPKFCSGSKIENDVLQFCFAFEQFCLPELTPAIEEPTTTPRPTVRKCAEVLPEARKVCNPFPKSHDTFNFLRCKNFLTNCKAYVDWVS
ncbi:unnamed protein product [Cylicocyclus nassatus]|uniref:Uncharacterized protein n=1 Tax=Cylicocyclus nassatus TaxID=53992 RepID=A0AA36DKS1_CYLNA|nr:unnamed protein product [Cylicocyclus nassatus]